MFDYEETDALKARKLLRCRTHNMFVGIANRERGCKRCIAEREVRTCKKGLHTFPASERRCAECDKDRKKAQRAEKKAATE